MIRRLMEKDAIYMLEWMKDPEITKNFRVNFSEFSLKDAQSFIKNSFDEKNQHFAFVDDQDMYLGTVSLKNISQLDKNAEYAIVTRKSAQGTGAAKRATEETLKYAFENLRLRKIYLNVLSENDRARCFYKKMGFELEGHSREHVCIDGIYCDLDWYARFY